MSISSIVCTRVVRVFGSCNSRQHYKQAMPEVVRFNVAVFVALSSHLVCMSVTVAMAMCMTVAVFCTSISTLLIIILIILPIIVILSIGSQHVCSRRPAEEGVLKAVPGRRQRGDIQLICAIGGSCTAVAIHLSICEQACI